MRSKLVLLLGTAVLSIAVLLMATQTWVTLELVPGASAFDQIETTGQQLQPPLLPLALAALAAALVLTISGRVLRTVLGVVLVLLGAGIAVISFGVMGDPWSAATGSVGEVTGLIGDAAAQIVSSTSTTPFIPLTAGCGAAIGLLGIAIVVLNRSWRTAGRKYEASSAAPTRAGHTGTPDRVSDWDSLSHGDDPTDDASEHRPRDEPGENSHGSPGSR